MTYRKRTIDFKIFHNFSLSFLKLKSSPTTAARPRAPQKTSSWRPTTRRATSLASIRAILSRKRESIASSRVETWLTDFRYNYFLNTVFLFEFTWDYSSNYLCQVRISCHILLTILNFRVPLPVSFCKSWKEGNPN